jgi:hypothetical protein
MPVSKSVRLDGFVDIECARWIHPVACASYSPMRGAQTFRHLSQLVDKLLAWRGWWWTWAGGVYDMLAIAEELLRLGIPCQAHLAGSRVSQLVSGDLRLVDAFALCPLPLDTACEIAGEPPVGPLGWDCRCGTGCGGYCSITEILPLDMQAELRAYCAEDARKGYRVVAALLELGQAQGYTMRATVGGTAWATARDWCDLPDASWHWSTARRIRRAYFGGRRIVGHAHARTGEAYDAVAAYPTAMIETALPYGESAELGDERAGGAYRRGVAGIYRATVRVPDDFLPALPWRAPGGTTAYPHGRLRGAWTSLELAAAEDRGVEIEEVHGAVVWPDGERKELAAFARHTVDARAAAGPETGLGLWYRELGNALTGKLAERPERMAVLLHPDPDKIVICDGRSERSVKSGCCVGDCTGRCGAWRQLDGRGRIWGVPIYRPGNSAHVHWAAWITSSMRIRLLEAAERVGAGLAYAHTDSIWATDQYGTSTVPGVVGDAPGEWKHEGAWGDWECARPDAYRYVDGATGEIVCRVSGMRQVTDRQWVAMRTRDAQIVDARGVMTFLEAAPTDKLFRRRARANRIAREDDGWRGDRRVGSGTGMTYAAGRGEIEERDARRGRQARALSDPRAAA